MRLLSWLLILALAQLLPGCGLVNTAYNNAPELLSWWLDDYFDFSQTQKAALNPALHQLQDWHRAQQLPEYVLLLKDLQLSVNQDRMSAAEACTKIERIKTSYSELQLQTVPIITDIGSQLTDKQMQYFRTRLEKRAQKWKDEWLPESPEDQLEVRLEKSVDFAEKVYGQLDDAQLALLKRGIAASAIQPALTYAEILRRNDDVQQILNAVRKPDTSAEQKARLVKAGFARLRLSPNPVYQRYADHLTARSCEVIADLHNTTSKQQKRHAYDYLESYIVQLQSLIKDQRSQPLDNTAKHMMQRPG